PQLLPLHRAVGRGRYRLVDGEGPPRGWRQRRLDGGAGQRHGPSARHRRLRARPRRVAGLRLRHRRRPAGDAQIWHGRSARLLRWRFALAEALRIQLPRRTDAERGGRSMKFSLSWLKHHLDTEALPHEIADRLTNIGLEVESVT